jgi:hypothetical protein
MQQCFHQQALLLCRACFVITNTAFHCYTANSFVFNMLVPFNPNWRGCPINEENIRDYTGYTKNQFIGLSGFYGFQMELEDEHCEISGEYPSIHITVEHPLIFLDRTVNIEKRTIKNNFFWLIKIASKSGFGLNVFRSQLEHSIKAGLKKIQVHAIGEFEELEKASGYIVWAKFGFIMTKDSQFEFDKLIQREKRPEKIVQDMYLNPEMDRLNISEGREIGAEFWKKMGSGFDGIFILEEGSFSRQYFDKYCQSKN